MQRDDAVAAGNVGERGGVVTALIVALTVPVEAVASRGGGVAGVAVVDGQVQRDDAVAAGSIGEHMSQFLSRGGDPGVLVPVEAVASHGGGVASVAVVDGQHHSGGAVATVGAISGEALLTALIVPDAIPLDTVASNDGIFKDHSLAVTDGEIQGHRAVATVDSAIHKGGSLLGSRRVGDTVPFKLVADVGSGVASVDVQLEVGLDGTVADSGDGQGGLGAEHNGALGIGPVQEVVARSSRGSVGAAQEVLDGGRTLNTTLNLVDHDGHVVLDGVEDGLQTSG